MTVSKEERYEAEVSVFSSRHEPGVRAVYEWLRLRRDEVNAAWPGMEGTNLSQAQGEAKLIAQLIRLIEQGPRIKQVPNVGGVS